MPVYTFTCRVCGWRAEVKSRRAPKCPNGCGRLERDFRADLPALRTSKLPGWPVVSQAMAVHPRDVPRIAQEAARRGVPTEFTRTGEPILTSPSHRARYMKAFGYVDLDRRP